MNTDRAQLAALDADGMHNTQRIKYEYGEFDTVKDDEHPNYTIDKFGFHVGKKTQTQCANKYDTVYDFYQCMTCSVHRSGSRWREIGGACSKAPSIIQTRSETHGDFTVNSHVSQAIKRAVRSHAGYMNLHDYQKEALDAVAGKIGRIVAGDAGFDDHWQDIAGYAELVRERLKK